MQGLQICGSYRHDRIQSPYDLARKTGKLFSTGEGSLRKLLNDNGAAVADPTGAGVSPDVWRKPGYIRAGLPGHRGPYATGPNLNSIPVWWGEETVRPLSRTKSTASAEESNLRLRPTRGYC